MIIHLQWSTQNHLISDILDFGLVDRELSFDCDISGSGLLGGGNIDRLRLAACVVRSGFVHWGVRDGGGAVIARAGLVVGDNLGVHGLTLVGDLGHVSAVWVSGVLHHLEPAVREGHGVGAHHHALLILGLGLCEL